MNSKFSLLLSLSILIGCMEAFSCTTFVLTDNNQLVYGRNFDFPVESGFIVNNLRGKTKYAFIPDQTKALQWTSKYGSITFNQTGMEFPYGGMNEKGLVIAQLYLDQTKYPEPDQRKEVSCLQWIQYHLDISASIDEVLASDTIIRISNSIPVGIHFLICDRTGKSATVEFINGEMVAHTNNTLPIPLLSNNTYEESYNFLRQFDAFGGKKPFEWNSINDFEWTDNNTDNINKHIAVAAKNIIEVDKSINLVESAFNVLAAVTIQNHTQWSTVFDIANMKIYFKNNQRFETIELDFKDFDFECNEEIKILDIQSANAKNTMEQFVPYSTDKNRDYIIKATIPLVEAGFIPKISEEKINRQARYPESMYMKK